MSKMYSLQVVEAAIGICKRTNAEKKPLEKLELINIIDGSISDFVSSAEAPLKKCSPLKQEEGKKVLDDINNIYLTAGETCRKCMIDGKVCAYERIIKFMKDGVRAAEEEGLL